jgi:hypothetical protein
MRTVPVALPVVGQGGRAVEQGDARMGAEVDAGSGVDEIQLRCVLQRQAVEGLGRGLRGCRRQGPMPTSSTAIESAAIATGVVSRVASFPCSPDERRS